MRNFKISKELKAMGRMQYFNYSPPPKSGCQLARREIKDAHITCEGCEHNDNSGSNGHPLPCGQQNCWKECEICQKHGISIYDLR